jgi:hypothetical protein
VDLQLNVINQWMRMYVASEFDVWVTKKLKTKQIADCMILLVETKRPCVSRLRVGGVLNLSFAGIFIKSKRCCSLWGIDAAHYLSDTVWLHKDEWSCCNMIEESCCWNRAERRWGVVLCGCRRAAAVSCACPSYQPCRSTCIPAPGLAGKHSITQVGDAKDCLQGGLTTKGAKTSTLPVVQCALRWDASRHGSPNVSHCISSQEQNASQFPPPRSTHTLDHHILRLSDSRSQSFAALSTPLRGRLLAASFSLKVHVVIRVPFRHMRCAG